MTNSVSAQSNNKPKLSTSEKVSSERMVAEQEVSPELTTGSSISSEESIEKKGEKGIIREESTVPTLSNSGSKIDAY